MYGIILRLLIFAVQYRFITADCVIEGKPPYAVCKCANMDEENFYRIFNEYSYAKKIYIKNSSMPVLHINQNYVNRNFAYINYIYIENTGTRSVIPGCFNGLLELEHLAITDNKLTKLGVGIFRDLSKLKSLNLTRNVITSLSVGCFDGMFQLESLDISNNRLSVLEDLFQYQISLRYVDASWNVLEKVEAPFDLLNFTTIILSDNKLKEFNFDHIISKQIETIDLSGNQLNSINIHNEDLVIGNLSLSRNNIKELPKRLKVINCNMSYNAIESFNNTFANSLELLDLSHNNVNSLTLKNFENISNLRVLNMSHNNISTLLINVFINSANLEHLDLSYNTINHMTFGHLNHLNHLKALDISNNNMTFDFQILSTLNKLEVLSTHNNNIENFDAQIFYKLPNLKMISLNDNIVNCKLLTSIVNKLQTEGVEIVRGRNVNETNIMGISCEHNKELNEEILVINKDANGPPVDDRFAALFKYLETIIKYLSNSSKTEGGSLNSTLNKLIKDNSNVLKVFTNEMEKQTVLIRNLSVVLTNLNPNNGLSQSSALITDSSQRNSGASDKQLIFLNTLFVLICFCVIILYVYEKYIRKPNSPVASSIERVELVNTL